LDTDTVVTLRTQDTAVREDDLADRGVKECYLVELCSRYSNRDDLLKPLVNVLDRINSEPPMCDPVDQLPSADGLDPQTWRISDRVSPEGSKALVQSYLAGSTIRVLAEQYGISGSSVKRLLREHGARKLPPRSAA
jgi:hypothetical protein